MPPPSPPPDFHRGAERAVTTLLHVVGARPNLMKLAPVLDAGRRASGLRQWVVHTGQHYDRDLSGRFFEELGLPPPDVNLEVGSASHAEQTAAVMLRLEPVLARYAPDWVVVYGDVNSTLGAALVAVKSGVKLAHVEAGLRSHDRSMPEEINRVLTDRVADLLFAPSRDACENLRAEGLPAERVRFVGNVMVDTLLRFRDAARALPVAERLGLAPGGYAFVTLHRPSNVDDRATLQELLLGLADLAATLPIVFPVHPRTRQSIQRFGLEPVASALRLLEPVGYLEALALVDQAALVLTDSGGLQEETTVLGVPCLTVRANTERPITIWEGTNRLVPATRAGITAEAGAVLRDRRLGRFTPRQPELWDGRAGERIIEALLASPGD